MVLNHEAAPGPRAYPIAEAFARLGIKPTAGFELIKAGELASFCIGRRRYITAEELGRFIERKIQESANESPDSRRAKVRKAVAGRAKQRSAAI